ncbi:MAG: ATP synthase F1 subunit epsilon [Acidobacteria bacterium 13_1_40CM_2_68_5]|nr:MAG: ATP synthase F1 subunit epsilon [Acidobacteria bacterium 13_1_40CM_2_68_5]OLE66541.1 MAG: ATP synthase F1 subunit epsilon [Acidobacteria bacterium 13_1_20CM_2_68_7]
MSPLPQSIRLEIVTPEQRLVNEVVDEVVLPGSEGSLGVLPGHTPLLSTLGIGWLMYRRGDLRRYLAIAWGFVEVLPDRVSVLAEIAESAETIDRERARKARDRALERLRGRGSETDFERAQIALQKAVIRIQVAEGAGPHEPA